MSGTCMQDAPLHLDQTKPTFQLIYVIFFSGPDGVSLGRGYLFGAALKDGEFFLFSFFAIRSGAASGTKRTHSSFKSSCTEHSWGKRNVGVSLNQCESNEVMCRSADYVFVTAFWRVLKLFIHLEMSQTPLFCLPMFITPYISPQRLW